MAYLTDQSKARQGSSLTGLLDGQPGSRTRPMEMQLSGLESSQ